jgi:diacylglycerol kinase (ATP)
MRAALLLNPNAGKGRAAWIAASLDAALRAQGIIAERIDVHAPDADARLAAAASTLDAVIVMGGDGTVHHALPMMLGAPAALYHFALGTENLVARELGHRADTSLAASLIAAGRTRTLDTGLLATNGAPAPAASPTPFVVMASIGPDASVVHRLNATRTGPISHLSYLRPILAELVRPVLPRMSIEADGFTLVTDTAGLLVIANSRQYALRTDPAPEARPDDGLLDVAFFPASHAVAVGIWLLRSRLRLARGCVRTQARQIKVRTSDPRTCLQLDGEAVTLAAGPQPTQAETSLTVTVNPGSLRVFTR